jgi:membrane dipeptidase
MANAPRQTQSTPVIDLLGGALGTLTPPRATPRDYARKLLDAGLTAAVFTTGLYARDIRPVLREYFDYHCLAEQVPERLLLVRTPEDILRARTENKFGMILGTQGLHYIEDETALITILAKLGLRVASLTYNEQTQFGAGCLEPTDHGLTLLGIRAVQELNRSRVLVDVSHAGHKTALDIIEASDKPVVATHSNAYAVTPSGRNLKDDLIRALAGCGGIVGLSPYSPFCDKPGKPRPDIEDFLDHIEYVAKLVGVRHVAIGTDFFPHSKVKWENSTGRMYPGMVRGHIFEDLYAEGLEDHHEFPAIASGLKRRGFAPADITAILGGNAIRVLEAVWPTSREAA